MIRTIDQSKQYIVDRVKINPISGCWMWTKSKNPLYGQACFGGKKILAHRLSWELWNDRKIPSGLCICHHCDVPACCNPKHLFLGTVKDNVQDAIKKGRLAGFTINHEYSKRKRLRLLADDEVQQIRASAKIKEPLKSVSKRFGISMAHVSMIRNGKRKQLVRD